jgi:hypothetical protein
VLPVTIKTPLDVNAFSAAMICAAEGSTSGPMMTTSIEREAIEAISLGLMVRHRELIPVKTWA